MMGRQIVFIMLFVIAVTLCGCGKPRTEVTYGTITKCQQCGTIMKQDLHKKLATTDEAMRLKVETQPSYCSECANRLVQVKTGSITKCKDCGKVMSRNVRVVKVKFRDSGGYAIAEKTALCQSCQPLPFSIVSAKHVGDDMVFRVRLNVNQLPKKSQMERTATKIWGGGSGGMQKSSVFLYLPGMDTDFAAYGVAEYDASGMVNFKVQEFALYDTKWAR